MLSEQGIRLESEGSSVSARVKAKSLDEAPLPSNPDTVVVYTVKLYDLEKWVRKGSDQGLEVFVQPSLQLREYAKGRKWGLIAFYSCARTLDGVVEYARGTARISIPDNEVAATIAEGLETLYLKTHMHNVTELPLLLWDYTIAHAIVQPLATLMGSPLHRLRVSRYAREFISMLLQEATLLVEAIEKRKLRDFNEAVQELLNVKGCYPRMLNDLESRLPTEVEYIITPIIREAVKAGVHVAYFDSVLLLVKTLEEVLTS
jgi:ketopantoate reductase